MYQARGWGGGGGGGGRLSKKIVGMQPSCFAALFFIVFKKRNTK